MQKGVKSCLQYNCSNFNPHVQEDVYRVKDTKFDSMDF